MFSPSIEGALAAALSAHQGQLRKGSSVPYAVHPLHVALMLARWGLDEEVIVAGLLHDVVEDCKDAGWTLERVERDFGARVAALVGELSEDKSRSWPERKRWAIDHVPHMSPQAASVKAADKLHNLQSLAADLRKAPDPDAVWKHFNGGREETLRMSRELVDALATRVEPRISRALHAGLKAVLDLAQPARAPRVAGRP